MRNILETDHLTLREMSLDADRDFIGSLLSDPEVMRFYPPRYVRDGPDPWIARQTERYGRHGHGLWLAVERATSRPVGQAGLVLQQVEGLPESEIGYMIQRSCWRRGFASEAAAGIRDFAFRVLRRPRVISLIHPDNLPSQGVALKVGMRLEKRALFNGVEHLVFAVEAGGGGVEPS